MKTNFGLVMLSRISFLMMSRSMPASFFQGNACVGARGRPPLIIRQSAVTVHPRGLRGSGLPFTRFWEKGRPDPFAPPVAAPPPQDRVVDRKERVRHEEYEAGRLVAEIRGDTFARGPDGLNRLTGSIEVAYFGPEGRAVSRLTAGEIAYAPGSRRFAVRGGVRIEASGVVLEGDSFEYDKLAGLFETAAGGRFASGTFAGEAPAVSYREGADEIRLGGGFRAELQGGEADGLTLSGRSLHYARSGRRGRIEGEAAIVGRDFRASSGTASFVAAADRDGLEAAVLEDGATVALDGKDPSAGGEIRAPRIEITFSRGPSVLAVLASGGAVLSSSSGEGGTESVAAPSIRLGFFRDIRAWSGEAKGGARAELMKAGGARRTVDGEGALYDGAVLAVTGAAGRPAVADSAEARLESPAIRVAVGSGDLLVEDGVTGIIRKEEGGRRTGFFSRAEDVSVSCGRLETLSEVRTTLLTGSVILSQGSASVRAGEIELAGDAGRMSGGGGVAVTLTEAGPEGRPARTVELGGQDMAFRPDSRTLTLTTKAFVRLPDTRLEAGSLAAVIARDGRAVESLEARKGVVVSRGGYTGRAEAASYDPSTGLLVLTGNPVLTDDKGGSARGAKLTFDLADDKILVENEGPGRSATVIRS